MKPSRSPSSTARGLPDLVAGPQVLDELVRLQDVGADLAAEADLALLVVDLGELGLALLLLQADQLGLEQGQGHGVVLVLRALAPRLGGDAGREVGVAHARLGLVLVLAARAAAPEDVALQLVVAEHDVDRVVDLGQDVDRGERRLPLVGGAERADPDQAVDPRLALEVAVGVLALDVDRRRLDAGDVPLLAVDDLGLVPLRLGPHQVHAQEHLGPVARLGAAGPGVDRDVGVAVVVRARRASSAARTPRSRPGPSPTPRGSRRRRRRPPPPRPARARPRGRRPACPGPRTA